MTPQHHIIKETSESVSRLLQEEFKRNGYKRVHIIEEAPKPDAVEGKLPAVSVYLYQVSLDPEGVDGHIAPRARRGREGGRHGQGVHRVGAGCGSGSIT